MKKLLKEWKALLYESADFERLQKLAQLGDEEAQRELDRLEVRKGIKTQLSLDLKAHIEEYYINKPYSVPNLYYNILISYSYRKRKTKRLPNKKGNKYKLIEIMKFMQEHYQDYDNQLIFAEIERNLVNNLYYNIEVEYSPNGIRMSSGDVIVSFDNNTYQLSVRRGDEESSIDLKEVSDSSNIESQYKLKNAISEPLFDNASRHLETTDFYRRSLGIEDDY